MKRSLSIICLILVLVCFSSPALASENIKVLLDGNNLAFDSPPVIERGRTLVPLRVIFESLGAQVTWDGKTSTVTAIKGSTAVKLTVGKATAVKNGVTVNLDVPPIIKNNRTLVPLRFVSEALGTYVQWDSVTKTITVSSEHISVHFLDVGQADSILIENSNGKNVLIDGGNVADGPEVVEYLKSQGISTLNLLIATHPHEDHIGGLSSVLNTFKVQKVIDSGVSNDSDVFREYMDHIKLKKIPEEPAKDQVIDLGNNMTIKVLGPDMTDNEDINNDSVVVRLNYKGESFLFTGDMEKEEEADLLTKLNPVDVLKVAHHGSSSSTTEQFLSAVTPAVAVISVGSGNDYGHPAQETISRLSRHGVKTYRTDLNGTVEIDSDGVTQNIIVQKTVGSSTVPLTPPKQQNSSIAILSLDLNNEIVTIKNNGNTEVDLTGWKLVSEVGSQTYEFPNGFKLKAGNILYIRSGPKAFEKMPADLKWTGAYIWNNDGDPGALYDSNGNLMSRK